MVGWDAAKTTDFQAKVQPIRDSAKGVLDALDALDIAKGALQSALNKQLAGVRLDINNLKTLPGYNTGIGESLNIQTSTSKPDAGSYQPTLSSAVAFPGYVRVTGKKGMAGSLNIYGRLKGQDWKLVAAKRSKFPFDDDSPLAQANTPETREYRAIGVDGDTEFGQPSEIVSVLYGG